MMFRQTIFLMMTALFIISAPSAHALGPVDGEIGIAVGDGIDPDSTFIYGEGWVGDQWGIAGAWYDFEADEQPFSEYSRYNLQVRHRLLSLSDNNFFAVGAGIENLGFENEDNTKGLRLSAEGRFGASALFLYGKIAWIPELSDVGAFEDISAQEIDAGIHITPFPFVSLRIGYLEYQVDYDTPSAASTKLNSSGAYLGLGVHW